MNNILVTGATGLLGPCLIRKLLHNMDNHVVTLVRDDAYRSLFFLEGLHQQVTAVRGDLLDFELLLRILNEYDISTVFHLGAQAIVGYANRSPRSTFASNIAGTWNLLEACRLSPWIKKIIVASSDKAYGHHAELPYTESTPLQGRHPYDVSKSCADLIAQSYAHTYQLPICVTRCGNFFGEGDFHFNRIIPGTIQAVITGQRPIIRSNGLFVRDYIYVQDVADAYLLLAARMDSPNIIGQCFNFSTDQPFTVIDIVRLILDLMQASHLEPLILNQATNEIPAQHLSSTKARTLLNWKPLFGVEDGLRKTIAWYKNYFANPKSCYEKNIDHCCML
ncbi:MAG: GDP-mannose 4,6-dehydratase [Candidatus Babeliales bacterium]